MSRRGRVCVDERTTVKVSALARPAMWLALDGATRDKIAHPDSRGMGPAARQGYGGGPKNDYYGSQEAALAWWKQSPGQNAILLDPRYTTVDIGFASIGVNAEKGYWAADFGTY